MPCEMVYKIHEGRPNPMDLMRNEEVALILLTSTGDEVDLRDGKELRRLALALDIPTVTTIAGCKATVAGLRAIRGGPLTQVRAVHACMLSVCLSLLVSGALDSPLPLPHSACLSLTLSRSRTHTHLTRHTLPTSTST